MASTPVYVPKKNGELRICIDYRELKKRTVKDAYPLPLPDDSTRQACRVQYILKAGSAVRLLAASGTRRRPFEDSLLSRTRHGAYESRRMPFGVTVRPSSFQRLMDKVIHGLPFVTSYIDDVLVHSSSIEFHKSHLQQVFDRLAKAGLTVMRTRMKCQLGLDKVQYLGHVFSKDGMAPDTEKISVVQLWPIPTDVTEVRQFLGLASYYRRYVKNFADIAAPFHHLTQKAVEFNWKENCQHSFQVLKDALTQAPVLCYPTSRWDSTYRRMPVQLGWSSVGTGRLCDCIRQSQSYST